MPTLTQRRTIAFPKWKALCRPAERAQPDICFLGNSLARKTFCASHLISKTVDSWVDSRLFGIWGMTSHLLHQVLKARRENWKDYLPWSVWRNGLSTNKLLTCQIIDGKRGSSFKFICVYIWNYFIYCRFKYCISLSVYIYTCVYILLEDTTLKQMSWSSDCYELFASSSAKFLRSGGCGVDKAIWTGNPW